MALLLDGTNNRIEFADGSTTDERDVLVNITYAQNSTRQNAGMYNQFNYWWEVSFTRQRTDSDIRVSGLIHGQENYCYPYYGTAIRLVAPNGATYLSDGGSHYLHTKWGNGNVPIWTEKVWLASQINSQDSGWKVQFGWRHTGSGTCRPFNIINYNNNEDGRAQQQGSHTAVYEIEP